MNTVYITPEKINRLGYEEKKTCNSIEFNPAKDDSHVKITVYEDTKKEDIAFNMDWDSVEKLANGLLQLKKQATGGFSTGGSLIAKL